MGIRLLPYQRRRRTEDSYDRDRCLSTDTVGGRAQPPSNAYAVLKYKFIGLGVGNPTGFSSQGTFNVCCGKQILACHRKVLFLRSLTLISDSCNFHLPKHKQGPDK